MSTVRNRFVYVLEILGLELSGLTLGCFRGGGAIELFEACQSLSRVAWRGRWETVAVMSRYLQEAIVNEIFIDLDEVTTRKIRTLAQAAPRAVATAMMYLRIGLSPSLWTATLFRPSAGLEDEETRIRRLFLSGKRGGFILRIPHAKHLFKRSRSRIT